MSRMGRPRTSGRKDLPPGLYEDKDGYYYIQHPITGERAYLKTKDRETAKSLYWPAAAKWDTEVIEKQAQKIARRLLAISKPGGARTFAQYATYYRTEKLPKAVTRSGALLEDATREDYRRMLENSIENSSHFAVPLEEVDDVVLRKYLSQWLDSPAYYNSVMSCLSRVFKCAIDEGLLRKNPAADVSRRTVPKRNVYVKDDDYLLITGNMQEWEAHACDLIYFNSHRPGDVLALSEDNISTYRRGAGKKMIVVSFTATKNDQAMEIVDRADGDLAKTLQWFRDWKKSQDILSKHFVVYPKTSRRRSIGQPVSVGYLSRCFAEAVIAAGFEKGKYKLKDLRKKGLTDEARKAGKPTNKGGHKTEQMRRLYVVGQLPVRVRNNLRSIR